jgi:hypothetical protein|tara:strand:- start:445 stop:633 length:189 start_codon:yes stop_codon:yes gene_type:complete
MSKVKESTELREKQLEDAAWAISQRNVQLRSFLLRLLDPNDLGHNVTQEVRELVNKLLVTPR